MRRLSIRVLRIILAYFFLGNSTIAQNTDVDNIPKTSYPLNSEEAKYQIALKLSKHYEESNLDSSLYFLDKSLKIAQKLKNHFLVAQSKLLIGQAHIYLTKNETEAIKWLNQAVRVAHQNNDYTNLANSYRLLGIVAEHQSNSSSLELLHKAESYLPKVKDSEIISDTYGTIYHIYSLHKKYKEAEKYILKELETRKKHNIDAWFTTAIDYCDFLENQNKFEQSYQFAQKVRESIGLLKKRKGSFVYLNDLGRLHIKLKEYEKAKNFFFDVIKFEKSKPKTDTVHLFYTFSELEKAYVLLKDYKNAHLVANQLAETRLWLSQKRQTQSSKILLTQLTSKLDLEKKEIEIKRLADKQNQQFFLLIAFIAVMALLSSLIIILEHNKKRIERQKEELSQINATKDRLFSIIAHDLRKPIASLKGTLQLFDNQSLSQAEFVELSKQLEQNVDNIHAMLENLLLWSLSQMNGIKPHFSRFNIAETVNETISLFGEMARQKQVRLIANIDNQLFAFADENQVQTVIRNLLNNAVKFSPINGQVEILGSADDKKVNLTFKDSGNGIKPDELATIFSNPKLNVGTKGEKGTGLGLVLSKELIEQNRGSISASSLNGQGSTFKISLPIA
ncbi:MAG: ATP-binding protein [Spirosomaceae bacterium]|jgi:signal transduction histidine kinase|nr:ATP-binding protein [Spirosomataceae bacterium]